MRTYRGPVADSSRWERFESRPDDVVISTPSKCGTTWMQHLVGMILLDRVDFGRPLVTVSPWLDVVIDEEDEVFGVLAAQEHRRFVKTHTPLDGLPRSASWTYITVFRNPFDVALSFFDHAANTNRDHVRQIIADRMGVPVDSLPVPDRPTAPEEFLRYWIDNDDEPDGSGPHGLDDYANSLRASWALRNEPNVHLFHYDDLWNDLDGQVARLADVLGVGLVEDRRSTIVEAATLDSMRSRATETAPFGDRTHWHDPAGFFASGGRRGWAAMLTPDEISGAIGRLEEMASPEAAAWALRGNAVD